MSVTPATAAAGPDRFRAGLLIAAIGIVFGDIATSPLYAMQEAFGVHGVRPTPENVLGVLSLVFWSLIGVVSLKYVFFIMRADNKGEGGIMALLALAQRAVRGDRRSSRLIVALGLAGAALFFGDGVITPAISVLSAVEGVGVAAPSLKDYIVPITVGILIGLFLFQRHGTAVVGKIFGPVMLVWLISIGLLGGFTLASNLDVLAALNPVHAVEFMARNGFRGFATLGAVVLVLTGAEALYADMGHFGPKPIRLSWSLVVLPALLLNYFGQGALLIGNPESASNPFYLMVPRDLLYPMIGLAAAATVIASQAIISGVYSMTREAIHLGYLPRMRVVHTSEETRGQVYLPGINAFLFVMVMAAVVGFGSAARLAAAFGIAVSGTMLITTVLALVVAHRVWRWRLPAVLALGVVMLTVDLAFLGANLLKFKDGGWFPVVLGIAILIVMTTWRRGRQLLQQQIRKTDLPLADFVASMAAHPPHRVQGTAVFLTSDLAGVPHALLHNLKHNQVLHERNVIVNVETLDTPESEPSERYGVVVLGPAFYTVSLRFGFAEDADVPTALEGLRLAGEDFDCMRTTFFLSRETIVATDRPGMSLWRDKLFVYLARNALPATAHFQIPGNRLVELGTRIEI
ncbi:KUP system potassium uptake protein [Tahibacter aquaticus]|uniref:Probable potassium transport system protein Kup n=1 Tax=Tahibacter aquaticus TaxID=520092 RepID=A0A4R6YIW4_9GAMM|nr:potassium transporter Kup [Tahibacter aquaticus]TDR36608.1 KUP system potassium uptake protein [Tahibacter aquaticus]